MAPPGGFTMIKQRWVTRIAALSVMFAVGCPGGPKNGGPKNGGKHPGPKAMRPLSLSKKQIAALPPKLKQRILGSPHGFFRFINIAFSREVCRRFKTQMKTIPTVNLHGDAHVEQYAITPDSAGLADFDDSSSGPAVIDLVRFGVSLKLACRAHKWPCKPFLDRMFAGYKQSLTQPKKNAPLPTVVPKVRGRFKHKERASFLAWATKLMQPARDKDKTLIVRGFKRYVEFIVKHNENYKPPFFKVKHYGRLRLGIGSALSRKMLVRIEGKTKSDTDDIILELKELRDISGIGCVTARQGDALRVILGQSRIGREQDPFLALVPSASDANDKEAPFWIRSWAPNYVELDVKETFSSKKELDEVVFDVGVQLGQGHTRHIAAPFDATLRKESSAMLTRHEAQIRKVIDELEGEVVASFLEGRKVAKLD
jgi:hypothetical protein